MGLERQTGYFGSDNQARLVGELENATNDAANEAADSPGRATTTVIVEAGDVVQAIAGRSYRVAARTDGDPAIFETPDPNQNLGKRITIAGTAWQDSAGPFVHFRIRSGGSWTLRGSENGLTFSGRNEAVEIMADQDDWTFVGGYK